MVSIIGHKLLANPPMGHDPCKTHQTIDDQATGSSNLSWLNATLRSKTTPLTHADDELMHDTSGSTGIGA